MQPPVSATVKAVFQAALERAVPAERLALLDEACGDDAALRDRVDTLLRAHETPDPLLDHSAASLFEAQGGGDGAAGPEEADDWLDFLSPPKQPGSLGRLDHYEILELAGQGGMGIVFRAFDDKLHRVVAIKALAPSLAASSPARLQFVHEARAAAAVAHDNVIAIYGVGDSGPVPYLVMQFVDGTSLQQKIEQCGPLPLSVVLRIGLHVAEGLAAAHRQGLVHRDVKPANVLLENGVERVKITDFGLARAGGNSVEPHAGPVTGTPAYMSPEQARGEPVDARSDLFSLGSLLYAMCTGRPPFAAASALASLERVCEASPRPVRETNAELPEWLDQLLARLHAKAPADRPASAREVADLLAGRLAELQDRGAPARAPRPPAASPSRAPLGRAGRWLRAAAAATVVGLAVVGVCEVAGVTNIGRRVATDVRRPGAPATAPAHPFTAPTAPDGAAAAWERSVAGLPPDEQARAVAARLTKLNPQFDGAFTHATTGTAVTAFRFAANHVSDLSPVRALPHLKTLECGGRSTGPAGPLADLTPLKGLPLQVLNFSNTPVSDLSPLRGMPLAHLVCSGTRVSDLSPLQGIPLRLLVAEDLEVSDLTPLRGMPLTWLGLYRTQVSDLSPLRGMPLEYLNLTGTYVFDLSLLQEMKSLRRLVLAELPITDLSMLRGLSLVAFQFNGTRVTDLSPIEGMPLTSIEFEFQLPRDAKVLRSLKSLEHINRKPVAEFWQERAE